MSDSDKNFPAIDPPRTTRARAGRYEAEIYVEDITARIPNKYLAVNVAAQRARVLNDRDLPVGEAAKQAKKPTTQALLELIDGRLTYEVQLPRAEAEAEEEFGEETDEGVAALFDEYADDDTSSAADDAAPFDEDA